MGYPGQIAPPHRILIVDEDPGLRDEVGRYLDGYGYAVSTAADAADMDRVMDAEPVDMVILDAVLPGEDGFSVCRRLAGQAGPAILMLSARGDQVDRVLGLELGADDYVAKPCAPRELLARVRAVLRRRTFAAAPAQRSLGGWRFAGLEMEAGSLALRAANGASILLTAGEASLLAVFLAHPHQVMSREELIEEARRGSADVFDRAVDVQISRLRRKLALGADAELIRTIRGLGYMLDCPVTAF